MKLSNSIRLALVTFTSFGTAARALHVLGSTWSMTNVPATGLVDITFPITIVEADHITGYYFAQQFRFFGDNQVGYTGIQPRPDRNGQSILHAVFSSFIPGTTTTDTNCHDGADGGPGVSCAVEWNGVYGRKYNYEVRHAGNRLWVGTAVDTVTGQRIHIGSYTLPGTTQGIRNSQYGFVEWFPWASFLPPGNCARLPYQKTIFGNPTTTRPGSVGTQSLSFENGYCTGQVAFNTERVVENNCGFRGQTGS